VQVEIVDERILAPVGIFEAMSSTVLLCRPNVFGEAKVDRCS